jgi:hypothetical protein
MAVPLQAAALANGRASSQLSTDERRHATALAPMRTGGGKVPAFTAAYIVERDN